MILKIRRVNYLLTKEHQFGRYAWTHSSMHYGRYKIVRNQFVRLGNSVKRCHVCGSLQIFELANSDLLKRVSSDCLPMFSATLLLSCLDCGALVTDTTPGWHRPCADVYAEYEVYGQSGGVEEKTFSVEGDPTPRSQVLTSLMAASGPPLEGAWLDFGCGNGSFLREVLGRFPGLAGYGVLPVE